MCGVSAEGWRSTGCVDTYLNIKNHHINPAPKSLLPHRKAASSRVCKYCWKPALNRPYWRPRRAAAARNSASAARASAHSATPPAEPPGAPASLHAATPAASSPDALASSPVGAPAATRAGCACPLAGLTWCPPGSTRPSPWRSGAALGSTRPLAWLPCAPLGCAWPFA